MHGAGKLSPIQGVKYVAEMKPSGKTVAITWYAPKGSDAWGTILEAVRALPRRKYNAATKRWEVPASNDMLEWLSAAGFPAPAPQAQQPVREVPAVDPVKEQREDCSHGA